MTTRQLTRTSVAGIAAAAVAVAVFTAPAQADTSTTERQRHQATQRALDATVAAGIPGALARTRDAHGVWQGASGVADRETGRARGSNDRFRIASITKTFVATVLLQMEAEGELDLDDTVERHLPGVVRGNGNDGSRITVRQLLNHTSGLYSYSSDPEYAEKYLAGENFLKHRYDAVSPETKIKVAMGHRPDFAPGARHSYSNTGYVLAGMVIEKVSGDSYEDEVRERIIKPLKLRHTTNPGDSAQLPKPSGRAYSKLSRQNTPEIWDVTEIHGSRSWAGGDIISTTGDLNRFFSALMGGKLLPKKQLKAMKTTVPSPDYLPGSEYGLGVHTYRTSCGTRLWGHGGRGVGSVTEAATTGDGRRQLSYNFNGDWAMPVSIVEAEFCDGAEAEGLPRR
ncbi:serine hydrolase domain-containing protein [Streptomyces katsurahamanus]|uniref:Beta-lactamase family protein n=1 Tax=Streptomyces katsurahamanus TaxID=2577098 RepID=A0ABW9P0R6_9ACTN|nr:serine hydrolase domain-containing protein [Streptomyces katsurahamanus]MQS39171.1 beta-lactamase family protein [Streptomyces katsurahamanus]